MAVLLMGFILFLIRDRIWTPSEEIVLSLQGSTSLGDELMPKLAAAFLRDDMGAVETGFRVAGKYAQGHVNLRVWGKVPGRSAQQVIQVFANGSSAAFECLVAEKGQKSCDIGMSSRPINDVDKARYPALHNFEDRDNEHVVALDAIAVIVNPRNPVTQLSIAQLRSIYRGQTRNWKEVGGDDAPIDIYGRDHNSGTFDMFNEKVLGIDPGSGSDSSIIPTSHQMADSGSIVNSITRDQHAIGYVSSP